jgi:hypothetical protein
MIFTDDFPVEFSGDYKTLKRVDDFLKANGIRTRHKMKALASAHLTGIPHVSLEAGILLELESAKLLYALLKIVIAKTRSVVAHIGDSELSKDKLSTESVESSWRLAIRNKNTGIRFEIKSKKKAVKSSKPARRKNNR